MTEDIIGDFPEDDESLFSTDYLQEDEELCDVCRNPKPIAELVVTETDENGGQAQVCEECIAKGWAEE